MSTGAVRCKGICTSGVEKTWKIPKSQDGARFHLPNYHNVSDFAYLQVDLTRNLVTAKPCEISKPPPFLWILRINGPFTKMSTTRDREHRVPRKKIFCGILQICFLKFMVRCTTSSVRFFAKFHGVRENFRGAVRLSVFG